MNSAFPLSQDPYFQNHLDISDLEGGNSVDSELGQFITLE
jgi:hypothetical protein